MSELLIMAYPKVEYGPRKQSFKIATVFRGFPPICLMTVPKKYFRHIEFEIEQILEHETLHIVLNRIEPKASKPLDNVLPWTHSLIEFANCKGKRMVNAKP